MKRCAVKLRTILSSSLIVALTAASGFTVQNNALAQQNNEQPDAILKETGDNRLAPQVSRKAGEVVLEQSSLNMPATGTVNFEFGTLYVPENRSDPKSRIIGVGFARFKASGPTTAPPTFHLPGGPGSSLLTGLQNNKFAQNQIALYRKVGDVVLVDQRGYSERGEILKFKFRTLEQPLDQPSSVERSTAGFLNATRAIVAEFARKGVDLRGYTVKECADDVNDLRRALGYERITLVGTSFGSQWSFAVMRRHPDTVARALLSGVEPLDYGYDMPSHVFAALQRMWWEAEKDPRLRPYIPPGGIAAAAREVLRRLDRAPIKVQAKVKDPNTGEMPTVTLGREDFQKDALMRGAAGPAFLLSLYYERYDAWAISALAARRSREVEAQIIGPLIDTSLGVTPRREHLLRTDAGTEFLGQWNFHGYLAAAEIWPTEDVGDEFRTEVVSQIPVVFAQGDWDTSTPIENTLNVAPYFLKGRVLIAEHGGHGVLEPISQHLPQVMEALLEFLRTGNTANLPARVQLPVPKFGVPDFPPPNQRQG
jgi:pimeloyl-ACP methyl ester carboxylesterase